MNVSSDTRLVDGGWLFERVNGLFKGPVSAFEPSAPPVDVVEDRDSYRFSIELPGVKGDSLELKIEEETLVVSATPAEPTWAKDARVHRAERHYGQLRRAFRLPGDVARDTIKAAYKDGVLEVTIAKLPEAKAVRVEVAYAH